MSIKYRNEDEFKYFQLTISLSNFISSHFYNQGVVYSFHDQGYFLSDGMEFKIDHYDVIARKV